MASPAGKDGVELYEVYHNARIHLLSRDPIYFLRAVVHLTEFCARSGIFHCLCMRFHVEPVNCNKTWNANSCGSALYLVEAKN